MEQEKVLVVGTKTLFPEEKSLDFIAGDFEHYAKKIISSSEFIDRSIAETDINFKQIIPYLVFMHDNKVFMMQRKSTAGEQRLKNKLSLGIGGHIRAEDFTLGASIIDWAQREFEEEVSYSGKITFKPLGIINSNASLVDQVHAGFVYLLEGDSPSIAIKEEMKSGELVSLQTCKQRYNEFERWSQIIIDVLLEK
ncbi:hypothetical protein FJ366_02770 [Candidatus Dependentiae bacterium]|nr:hypothetical protein [Candidatus Dependentiae bacterium]